MPKSPLTLFGNYHIIDHLGRGGMCDVYRARLDGVEPDLALKVLRPNSARNKRVSDLFLTEADLSSLLSHPNLVHCIDAGVIEGHAYMVMELLDGGNLRELLVQLKVRNLQLPDDLSLFILSEVLSGLDALHTAKGASGRALNVIHRDVTAKNIFLGLDGRVILGDYGVSHVNAFGPELEVTIPGKLQYLAPECLTDAHADVKTDIYSVSIILYELLVGRRPFSAVDEEELRNQIVSGTIILPREIRASIASNLERILLTGLAKNPNRRYRSASDFGNQLKKLIVPSLGNKSLLSGLLRGIYSGRKLY